MVRRGLIVLVALALVGCGNVADKVAEKAAENQIENAIGGNANVDINDDTVKIQTDEGSMSFGGGEIPADFPVPFPDGGEVVSVITNDTPNGPSGSVSVDYPADSYDMVKAFYDDYFAGQDITRNEITGDGALLMYTGQGSSTLFVGVTPSSDSVSVTVSVDTP